MNRKEVDLLNNEREALQRNSLYLLFSSLIVIILLLSSKTGELVCVLFLIVINATEYMKNTTRINEIQSMLDKFDIEDCITENFYQEKDEDVYPKEVNPITIIHNNENPENLNDNKPYQEVPENIHKYIRKLPEGRKASEKAKALAREYGYELKDGETFISPKK